MERDKMRHPLDIGPDPTMPPWARRQFDSPGVVAASAGEIEVDMTRLLPITRGRHHWVQELLMPALPEAMRHGGLAVRLHLLAQVRVFCYTCGENFCGDPSHNHGDEVDGECPGDDQGRYMPTQSEFRGWTEAQKEEWGRSL